MTDFAADFVQTTKDLSNQKRTYRGLLYLKKGRKLVFNQKEPEPKILYSDGKWSTEYRVVRKQAERTPLGKADDERFQLFQIPWNPELRNQFKRIEEPGESPLTPGHRLVRLIPEKANLPVILLEVDPETSLIHRFEAKSPDGVLNEFRFTEIKTTPLDPAIFEPKLPADVQVIVNRTGRR